MAKKKVIPEYSKITKNGIEYYRTRILDADGKQVDIYGKTCEEVYDKAQAASRAVAEAIFRKNNPTVREYCEKWLKMKSATVRPNTLEGYRKATHSHRVRKRLVSRRSAEGIVTRTSSKNIVTTYCKGSLLIKGAALFLYPVAERRNPSCRNACSDTNGLSCPGLICRSARESWVIGQS